MPTRYGTTLAASGPGGAYEFTQRDSSSRAFARDRRFGSQTYGAKPPMSITTLPLNMNVPLQGAIPQGGSALSNGRMQLKSLHLAQPYAKYREAPDALIPPHAAASDNNGKYAYGSGMNAPYIEQDDDPSTVGYMAKKLRMPRQQFMTYSRLVQRQRVLHKVEYDDDRHYKHHVVNKREKQDLGSYEVPKFNEHSADVQGLVVACCGPCGGASEAPEPRLYQKEVSEFNDYMTNRVHYGVEDHNDLNIKAGEAFPMVPRYESDTPDSAIAGMGLSADEKSLLKPLHHTDPQPPLLELDMRNHTVWEGQSVTFIVKASGKPSPIIQWYHNMVPIEPELWEPNKYIIKEMGGMFKITINRVTKKDAGIYRGCVQNLKGAVDAYGYLNVKSQNDERFGYYDIKQGYNSCRPMDYPDIQTLNMPGYPRFVTRLYNHNVFEQDAVTLTAKVEGKPKPDVFWTLNGNEVKHIPGHIEIAYDQFTGVTSLTIFRAHTDDEGEYAIRAYNRDGASISKGYLFVKGRYGPPSAPADLQVVSKDSTHFILQWRRSAYEGNFNPPPIDGYRVEYCAVGSVMWKEYNVENLTKLTQYAITNMDEDTAWFFRVRAVNAWGRSPPSRPCGPNVFRDPGTEPTPIELEDPIKYMIPPEADEIWVEEEEPDMAPGVPSDVQAEYIAEGTMAISFNEPRDPEPDTTLREEWRKPMPERSEQVDGYLIEYAEEDSDYWKPANIDMINHCNDPYPVSGLVEGRTYKFKVIAVNTYGRGDPAVTDSILVQAPEPEEPEEVEEPEEEAQEEVAQEEEVAKEEEASEEQIEGEEPAEECQIPAFEEEEEVKKAPLVPEAKSFYPAKILRYRGPPSQPQQVDYRKTYRDYIEVCWMPPAQDGGEQYLSYYIEMSKLGSGIWNICNQKSTHFTQFVCNNCVAGEKYVFRVRCVSKLGTSGWSNASSPIVAYDGLRPPQYFGPVQSFMSIAQEDGKPMITRSSIKIQWESPQRDGGATVQGYHLEFRSVGGKFRPINNRGLFNKSFMIDEGLVEGESYQFRVRAFNISGVSAWIYLPESITCRDPRVPDVPFDVYITGLGNEWCTMKWFAPEFKGDFTKDDFLGYCVEKRKEGSDLWLPVNRTPELCTGPNNICNYKADMLVYGETYFFRIFAVSKFGRSKPSMQSCFVRCGEPYDPDVIDRQAAMYAERERIAAEKAAAELERIEREKREPFVRRLQDYWGYTGGRAYFEVELKDPTWEVEWFFGNDSEDKILPDGKWNIISIGAIRKMVVDDLDLDCVKIINVHCHGVNSNADLMVDGVAPAHFVERLFDQDIAKGEDCVMRVTLTQSVAEVKWYKWGNVAGEKEEITNEWISEHIEIINQGATRCVIIRGVTYDDIATYSVEGPNGTSTCSLSVDGFHPIQFEKGLEDLLNVKHTEAYIQFEAIVIPSHKDDFKQPEMTWLYDDKPGFAHRDGRDGREVTLEDEQLEGRVEIVANGNMRSLRINCPRWDDSGRFTLYHPGGFTSAILKVLPPPPPPAPPVPMPEDAILHFRKGLRAEHRIGGCRLYTEIENLPEDIIITWSKNGKEVVENERTRLYVDYHTGVVAVEIDNICPQDAGRYQAAFVTPMGMFDTRVNYDFSGDLFKAIMRKALDLQDDEELLAEEKANKANQEQTQEIVVEEEDEEDENAEVSEMLCCFKSPKIAHERQEGGQLLLWVEIDNQQESTQAKWYKNGEELESGATAEYNMENGVVGLVLADFSTSSGEYVVELSEGSNSIQSLVFELTGETFDALFE